MNFRARLSLFALETRETPSDIPVIDPYGGTTPPPTDPTTTTAPPAPTTPTDPTTTITGAAGATTTGTTTPTDPTTPPSDPLTTTNPIYNVPVVP